MKSRQKFAVNDSSGGSSGGNSLSSNSGSGTTQSPFAFVAGLYFLIKIFGYFLVKKNFFFGVRKRIQNFILIFLSPQNFCGFYFCGQKIIFAGILVLLGLREGL